MVYNSLAEIIGNTPLLKVKPFDGQKADIIVKLEYFNPGGSVKALGATLELTPGAAGMKGAIARAEELRDSTPGAVILGQFTNPANPAVHERTTGEEIWRDTEGKVDIFVAGVGTGGTVSGTGKALKKHNPAIKVVAVEPASSAVLSTGVAGKTIVALLPDTGERYLSTALYA